MNSRGASPARSGAAVSSVSVGGGDTDHILAKVLPTLRVSPTPVTTSTATTGNSNPNQNPPINSNSISIINNGTLSSSPDPSTASPVNQINSNQNPHSIETNSSSNSIDFLSQQNQNSSGNSVTFDTIGNGPSSATGSGGNPSAGSSASPGSTQQRAVVLPAPIVEPEDETKRYCWVCFATDEDDMLAPWVQPCRCRGTTKWVHQACIQRWIDEKQKGNTAAKVSCPQCNTEYLIFYPKLGTLVLVMDSLDALISRVCPFVAAGIVVGSIYWTAVTYGAVTVMQVAGHKEGLTVMEQADPLVLLVGLPTIPVMLILGKMVRWEDQVLRFIRKHSWKIPLLRHILPSLSQPSIVDRVSQDLPALSDPVSATRILCGALLLPTVATVLGKVLFENVRSNFRRAILGGVAFITIKGVLRIYHKQQQYIRQSERKIVDFVEPPRVEIDDASAGDHLAAMSSALSREVLRHANLHHPTRSSTSSAGRPSTSPNANANVNNSVNTSSSSGQS